MSNDFPPQPAPGSGSASPRRIADTSPAAEAPPTYEASTGSLLLSICIPTWNRADLLADALRCLEEAIIASKFSQQIEVLVGDNCSSDSTREFLTQYQDKTKLLHFRAIRHAANLGADGNILRLADAALGDYLFFVSDDDQIIPDGLGLLLEIMAEKRLDYYVVSVVIMPSPKSSAKSAFIWHRAAASTTLDDFVMGVGSYLSFISVLAFRRRGNYQDRFNQRMGTNLLQSYIFIDAAAAPSRGFLVEKAAIAMRPDASGGYSFPKVFVSNYLELLAYARSRGLTFRTFYFALAEHLNGFVRGFIIQTRLSGAIGSFKFDTRHALKLVLQMWRRNLIFTPQWVTLACVLVCPRWLLVCAKRLKSAASSVRGKPGRLVTPPYEDQSKEAQT